MTANQNTSRREPRNWFYLFGLLMLWFAFATDAWGVQNLVLNWDASSSTNVKGYFVYYGTNGQFHAKLDVGNHLSASIPALQAGQTYSFSVTAYTANGVESDFSPLVSYIIPGTISLVPPAHPGDPMVVQFPVASGHTYQVQATQDFKTWTTLWVRTATTNQVVQFSDAQSSQLDRRFYRVAVQ